MMLAYASRAATLALIEDATNEVGKPCTDWSMVAGLSIDNGPRVYREVRRTVVAASNEEQLL